MNKKTKSNSETLKLRDMVDRATRNLIRQDKIDTIKGGGVYVSTE